MRKEEMRREEKKQVSYLKTQNSDYVETFHGKNNSD